MNFLKPLCSLFRPRYHLYNPINSSRDPETGKEEPRLIDSFYTRSAYKKAKADLERKHRVESAKQNGTFFRIEVDPRIFTVVRREIFNIQDSEIVSSDGYCRIEYISPRKHRVFVRYDEGGVSIFLATPQTPAKSNVPSETPAPSNP